MSESAKLTNCSEEFLDKMFALKDLKTRERMYGHGSSSHGGIRAIEDFSCHLALRPGQKVMDIGCGFGINDFYVAKQYGVDVLGLDLNTTMISLANENLEKQDKEVIDRVRFKIGNVLTEDFPAGSFDAIFSRDSFMYIGEMEKLFKRIHSWLKPGGRILMTDFFLGETESSAGLKEYISTRQYTLMTVDATMKLLQKVGFGQVDSVVSKDSFLAMVRRELKIFENSKENFIKDFGEEEYDAMVSRCQKKLTFAENGEFTWGAVYGTRI